MAIRKMDDSLLNFYKKEWERYKTALRVVDRMFLYLNRNWIRSAAGYGEDVYDIYTLGMSVWRTTLFLRLKPRLNTTVMGLIEKERNGEGVDTALIHGMFSAYEEIAIVPKFSDDYYKNFSPDVFLKDFEEDFLETTELYYTKVSTHYLSGNLVGDYVLKVQEIFKSEMERVVTHHLPSSLASSLVSLLEHLLIRKQISTIQSQFGSYLHQHSYEKAAVMYDLLSRVDALGELKKVFSKFVLDYGNKSIGSRVGEDLDDPTAYFDALSGVYSQFSELVKRSFSLDPNFVVSMEESMTELVNDNVVTQAAKMSQKSPELLARYCDLLLKKSKKNCCSEEVMQKLECVMRLFEFVNDKDVFQTFYSQLLAKRLVMCTSSSESLEREMLEKLKKGCGFEYWLKCNKMFSDVVNSSKFCERFLESPLYKGIDPMKFKALVLANGPWPLSISSSQLCLPLQLSACVKAFTIFYNKSNSGRKLHWLHQYSLGKLLTLFLKMRTKDTGYILKLTTYQMILLLLFEENNELKIDEMEVSTRLDKKTIYSALAPIMKLRLLKWDNQPTLPTTKFSLNPKFMYKTKAIDFTNVTKKPTPKTSTPTTTLVTPTNTSTTSTTTTTTNNVTTATNTTTTLVPTSVAIPTTVTVTSSAITTSTAPATSTMTNNTEYHETLAAIEEMRKHMIQATIVRIMKSRKQIKHPLLMAEVSRQLKGQFKATPGQIKQQMDEVLTNGYMMRSEESPNIYLYVA
eukprot:TRINITY_DN825_c0_g2_i5.p1 TRINITY_DN825_c0_g2~~TRINITY_DN825_c0_g2_i5.p1  ORF type:complete len:742 (+),score=170.62 TRINITY_DN825_c0_g2_i5:354-2579(+)